MQSHQTPSQCHHGFSVYSTLHQTRSALLLQAFLKNKRFKGVTRLTVLAVQCFHPAANKNRNPMSVFTGFKAQTSSCKWMLSNWWIPPQQGGSGLCSQTALLGGKKNKTNPKAEAQNTAGLFQKRSILAWRTRKSSGQHLIFEGDWPQL